MTVPTDLIINNIKTPPKYFINAGAGIGGNGKLSPESLIINDAYPNIKIFGVEAAENRCKIIEKDFPGKLFNLALGNKNEDITMYVDPCGSGTDMVIGFEATCNIKECIVKCVTLDSFCNDNNITDNICLWCDCEGFELKILQGATSLLKAGAFSSILLELWKHPPVEALDPNWARDLDIITLLEEYDYELIEKTQGSKYDAVFMKRGANEC